MDIKSKNKLPLRAILLTLLSVTAVLLFLFNVVDALSAGYVINLLYQLPYLAVWQKPLFFCILLVPILLIAAICTLIVLRISERRARRQTEEKLRVILESIDTVFRKGDGLLSLPPEFADAENKLNAIRNENIRNEQLAKEAEQRKNDLVVYLAHDLKTPLTSVIGYLTLLRDEPQISEELRVKYLGITLDKARRLEDLINEFFDITRFSLQNIQLDCRALDLNMMLQQLLEEFYPVLSEKQLTAAFYPTDQITLLADPDKLARVFDNLLRNAAAYSTPGTEIAIRLSREEGGALVRFENHGPEIPPPQQQVLFQKFYRLDAARSSRTGGAGLGLAIAKELVELHGGEIWVESSAEITRFCVRLPLGG